MNPGDSIEFDINGQRYVSNADGDTPLHTVLHNDLRLTAAKFGCGLEQCGACLVFVDDSAIKSCGAFLSTFEGREVVTLEGLAADPVANAVRNAFVRHRAAQCGFCIPGMVMAAIGLLVTNPEPDQAEIRRALDSNLCRCGTHTRILRAVSEAAATLAGADQPLVDRGLAVIPGRDLATSEGEGWMRSPSIASNPHLDTWIRVDPLSEIDGERTITVFSGKVELGQGVITGLALIAAEELDVDPRRIRVATASTGEGPTEGGTTGSDTIAISGTALGTAAAAARAMMLAEASARFEVDTADLVVIDGVITADNVTLTDYWELQGGVPFDKDIPEDVATKRAADYRLLGGPDSSPPQELPRIDIDGLIDGTTLFVHDLAMESMVHARVVRPSGQEMVVREVDPEPARAMPGVLSIVVDGSFLGVVAEREEQAMMAADRLSNSTRWDKVALELPPGDLPGWLLEQPRQRLRVVDGKTVDDGLEPDRPVEGAHHVAARYSRPFLMHGSIGPSAALAWWDGARLRLWSHSQNVIALGASVATVVGLEKDDVEVVHVLGSGCYGHNGADDAALDAALLAMAVPQRPVLLKWSRQDEHLWEPYGAPMVMELSATLDDSGQILEWSHEVTGAPQANRPRPSSESSGLLAAWHRDVPMPRTPPRIDLGNEAGIHRNAWPIYDLGRSRVVKGFVGDIPLRTSSLRSQGAFGNVFAIESFMDELAEVTDADPVEFRLRHLGDPRAREVLEKAAEVGNWGEPTDDLRGRGIAIARYKNRHAYVAVVVEGGIDNNTLAVALERAVIVCDAGLAVDPDGIVNQLEGGFVQAMSWTLLEQVRYDETGVTSVDWDSYPIARFSDVPAIDTVLISRPTFAPLGVGEASQPPTPAAIANAVSAATGIRVRDLPMTQRQIEKLAVNG